MGNNESSGTGESKDMLYLVGGLALLVAGAGLIMAHPTVRQQMRTGLGRVLPGLIEPGNIAGGLSTIVPDFERYMKIRAM
jgi:LPXTG-motif cell wall-anchored protein